MGRMTMTEWAQNEIAIACAREKSDTPDDEWDYGVACYESALRAFNSLMEDGHSGFSIHMTKHILNRLIDGKCLTPIEDKPDMWFDDPSFHESDGTYTYQCKRCFSLFKDVYPDGTVKYHDNDRCYCKDVNTGSTFGSGRANRLINEMFPITMPYMPSDKSYVMLMEDFLYDPKYGDYDTVAYHKIINPDGKEIIVNKYMKETDNGFVDIDYKEFLERKASYLARKIEEEPDND